MKPEIKQKWLDALRSGEYNHGTIALKRTREGGHLQHCALGVLCEVHSQATGEQWRILNTNLAAEFRYYYYGFSGSLHSDVVLWAGLEDDFAPFTDDKGQRCTVCRVNDTTENYDAAIEAIERYL